MGRRAKMAGWMDPLSNCITIQVGHATYSVLTDYGRLSMDDITKHARFKEDRDLYVQEIPIRAALFKLLMSKTVVDAAITTSKYCINLQNLDTYMVTVKFSIPDFNQHVKNNITRLKSIGKKSDDLI
eukprot:6620083-Ditylum_brightwellii.AAC.1